MNNYKKIVENALKKANKSKTINESVLYPENMSERMHPKLEEDLIKRTHSLGKHPIFPEGDESLFEEKIMGEKFILLEDCTSNVTGFEEMGNIFINTFIALGGKVRNTGDL
jgi:hypothetical protein